MRIAYTRKIIFISSLSFNMRTMSNSDLNLLAVACVCIIKKKQNRLLNKQKPRRKWVKKWLLQRDRFSHVKLLEELRLEPDDFRNYVRMDEDSYVLLLNLVTPLIQKQDTCMRFAISPL